MRWQWREIIERLQKIEILQEYFANKTFVENYITFQMCKEIIILLSLQKRFAEKAILSMNELLPSKIFKGMRSVFERNPI